METSYVKVELSADGTVDLRKSVFVPGRANATEVRWADAVLLPQRAHKLRPDLDWQIDRTYSGKYVVRGLSKG